MLRRSVKHRLKETVLPAHLGLFDLDGDNHGLVGTGRSFEEHAISGWPTPTPEPIPLRPKATPGDTKIC